MKASSINTLSDSPLSVNTEKLVLESFQGLLSAPNVLERVERAIDSMDNGIKKKLIIASLRRIQNINSQANRQVKTTREKLNLLLARMDSNQQQSA
jgi:hypothetical protein